MVYLTSITWFATIFIVGLLVSIFSIRFKLPEVFLLILTGLAFRYIIDVNVLDTGLLAAFGMFALMMIVFESVHRIKLKEIASVYPNASKLAIIFTLLTIIILTISTHLMFMRPILNGKNFLLSLLFGTTMCGTSPSVMLSLLNKGKNKIFQLIKIESILNTPLTIILPLIVIDIYFGRLHTATFVIKFLQQIATGLGAGLIVGFLIFKILKGANIGDISPLVIVGIVLGTFVISENIGGNGILAVTTLAIMFGRSIVKDKVNMEKFTDLFTEFVKIIIFVLLGIIISMPNSASFIIKATILFLIYLFIRYYAVRFTFKTKLKEKETLFLSMNVAKGIGVAVLVFIIKTYSIPGVEPVLALIMSFILMSIILSSTTTKFHKYFLSKR